jgi:hypothetical protein
MCTLYYKFLGKILYLWVAPKKNLFKLTSIFSPCELTH